MSPRRNPTPANLGQIAPVPLFVKAPGQRHGRVVDRHVCTTDILPMTARMLGIDYPWPRYRCPPGRVTVADSPQGATSLPFDRVERLARRIRGANRPHLRQRQRLGAGAALPAAPRADRAPGRARWRSRRRRRFGEPRRAEQRFEDVDPSAPVVLASLLRGAISAGRARRGAGGGGQRADRGGRAQLLGPRGASATRCWSRPVSSARAPTRSRSTGCSEAAPRSGCSSLAPEVEVRVAGPGEEAEVASLIAGFRDFYGEAEPHGRADRAHGRGAAARRANRVPARR